MTCVLAYTCVDGAEGAFYASVKKLIAFIRNETGWMSRKGAKA